MRRLGGASPIRRGCWLCSCTQIIQKELVVLCSLQGCTLSTLLVVQCNIRFIDIIMSKKRACAEAGSTCAPKSKLVDGSSKLELLPDPQTMSHEAKAISSKMKNAFHTMDELDLFNQSKKRLDKISKDSKLSWIIGKYGWNTVHPIASCLNSIPSS